VPLALSATVSLPFASAWYVRLRAGVVAPCASDVLLLGMTQLPSVTFVQADVERLAVIAFAVF